MSRLNSNPEFIRIAPFGCSAAVVAHDYKHQWLIHVPEPFQGVGDVLDAVVHPSHGATAVSDQGVLDVGTPVAQVRWYLWRRNIYQLFREQNVSTVRTERQTTGR